MPKNFWEFFFLIFFSFSISHDDSSPCIRLHCSRRVRIRFGIYAGIIAIKSIDMWFGKLGADAGISPMPYFVSPAAALSSTPIFKARFNMNLRDRTRYIRAGHLYGKPASGRYLIMQKAGMSLHRFMASRSNSEIAEIIQLITAAMERISRLHSLGYNHGDIHAGSIVLDSREGVMKLIDLGRAFPIRANRRNERLGL